MFHQATHKPFNFSFNHYQDGDCLFFRIAPCLLKGSALLIVICLYIIICTLCVMIRHFRVLEIVVSVYRAPDKILCFGYITHYFSQPMGWWIVYCLIDLALAPHLPLIGFLTLNFMKLLGNVNYYLTLKFTILV